MPHTLRGGRLQNLTTPKERIAATSLHEFGRQSRTSQECSTSPATLLRPARAGGQRGSGWCRFALEARAESDPAAAPGLRPARLNHPRTGHSRLPSPATLQAERRRCLQLVAADAPRVRTGLTRSQQRCSTRETRPAACRPAPERCSTWSASSAPVPLAVDLTGWHPIGLLPSHRRPD